MKHVSSVQLYHDQSTGGVNDPTGGINDHGPQQHHPITKSCSRLCFAPPTHRVARPWRRCRACTATRVLHNQSVRLLIKFLRWATKKLTVTHGPIAALESLSMSPSSHSLSLNKDQEGKVNVDVTLILTYTLSIAETLILERVLGRTLQIPKEIEDIDASTTPNDFETPAVYIVCSYQNSVVSEGFFW